MFSRFVRRTPRCTFKKLVKYVLNPPWNQDDTFIRFLPARNSTTTRQNIFFKTSIDLYWIQYACIETDIVVSFTINSYIKINHLKLNEWRPTIFQMIDRTFEMWVEENSLFVSTLSRGLNDNDNSWNTGIHLLIRYILRYYCRKTCGRKNKLCTVSLVRHIPTHVFGRRNSVDAYIFTVNVPPYGT